MESMKLYLMNYELVEETSVKLWYLIYSSFQFLAGDLLRKRVEFLLLTDWISTLRYAGHCCLSTCNSAKSSDRLRKSVNMSYESDYHA